MKLNTSIKFIFFGVFLFLVGCSSQKVAQQPSERVSYHSKKTHQTYSFTNFMNRESLKTDARYADFYLVNLHFRKTPPPALRAKLEKEGITLNHYLGQRTYAVAIHVDTEPLILQHDLIAGVSLDHREKTTQKLRSQFAKNPSQSVSVDLIYHESLSDRSIILELTSKGFQIEANHPFFHHIRIKTTAQAFDKIKFQNWLNIADLALKKEPLGKPESDYIHASFLQTQKNLTGKNIRVGIWDQGILNANHPALKGRVKNMDNTSVNYHAMTVAGILGASGRIQPYHKGCAPEVSIYSWNYDHTGVKILSAIQDHDIVIGNHSYGYTAQPNGFAYNVEDQQIDQIMATYPHVSHLFAVGNSGSAYKTTQNASKNTIMVGAIGINDLFSSSTTSKGSTRDGRIKPDVVAAGFRVATLSNTGYGNTSTWGTSQATPSVTGLTAQLYQYYTAHYPTKPDASLMKAVLCNTARDVGNKYPDYTAGFGRVDGVRALRTLEDHRFLVDEVAHGQAKHTSLVIPANTTEVKITLCWTDPKGTVYGNATPVLVNNLDLTLKEVSTGVVIRPWVLDPNQPSQLATRGIDNLNNIEQITLENPPAGTYQILVSGTHIPVGATQKYALTWQAEQTSLEVVVPAKDDLFEPNTSLNLYWLQSGINTPQKLDYSIDNGATWKPILGSDHNPMSANSTFYYQWNIPNHVVTKQARVRISANGIYTISDPFTIFGIPKNLTTRVFDHQVGLHWTTVSNATHYDVFRFDEATNEWVEVIQNHTAHFCTVSGLEGGKNYAFSVRAKNNSLGITGLKSTVIYATPHTSSIADLAVTKIINPAVSTIDFIRPTATEFITIRIKNKGNAMLPASQSLTVQFWVDGTLMATQNFMTANILPNDEFDLQITSPAHFSQQKKYNLKTQIYYANDPASANNSLTKIIDATAKIKIASSSPKTFCTASIRIEAHGITPEYVLSTITPQLEDLTSGSTPISLPDHGLSNALPLGFRFPFYEKWYEHFYISDEGLITFSPHISYKAGASGAIANSPKVHNFVAGVWSDFNPAYGIIRYKHFGISPNRKLVVEFKDYPYFETSSPYTGYSTERATFQIHLYETGQIELHYQNVASNSWASSYTKMTAGIESPDGKSGVALAGKNNTAWSVASPEAYRFAPSLPIWSNGSTGFFTHISNSGVKSVNWTQNAHLYSLSETYTKSCGTSPIVTDYYPKVGAGNVSRFTELRVQFDENIQQGTGNITVSDGTDIRVFPIAGNADTKVEITNDLLKISFKTALKGGVTYHVLMDNGVVKNMETPPLGFAGISNASTWKFSTQNDAPTDLFLSAVVVDNNLPDGSLVGKFQVHDPNITQNHTYAIVGGTGQTQFRVVNNTLLTNGTLTFASTYALEVEATDSGIPHKSVRKLFTINMNFVTIIASFHASENTPNQPTIINTKTLKNQAIVFDKLPFISFGKPFTLNATSKSGEKVTYRILTENATVYNDSIYPSQIGKVEILMTALGGKGYKEAQVRYVVYVKKRKIFLKESQINTISDKVWTLGIFKPDFGYDGLVFEVVQGTAFATVTKDKIQLHRPGRVRLKIYLPERKNDLASNPIFRDFNVLKAVQKIDFKTIPIQTFGSADYTLQAISSSGLKIVFHEESDFINIQNNVLQIRGAGRAMVIAKQAGNVFYWPTQTQQEIRIQKAEQRISLDQIGDKNITDEPFFISAASTSKLPVNIRINPAHLAELINKKIHLKGVGKVQVIASQQGNENYKEATKIIRHFKIFTKYEIIDYQINKGKKITFSLSENLQKYASSSIKLMLSNHQGSFQNHYILYVYKDADGILYVNLPENLAISNQYRFKILINNAQIETQPKAILETLFPKPDRLHITKKENMICALGKTDAYVWRLNNELLNHEKNSCILLNKFNTSDKLIFTVQGKNNERLGDISKKYEVIFPEVTGTQSEPDFLNQIIIYPNPSHGSFTLEVLGYHGEIRYEIMTVLGQTLQQETYTNRINSSRKINLEWQSGRIYLLKLETKNAIFLKKIIMK